jgi:hypothetical protein
MAAAIRSNYYLAEQRDARLIVRLLQGPLASIRTDRRKAAGKG